MHLLFQQDPLFPNGFSYKENFITGNDGQMLLDHIGRLQLHTFKFYGYEARRLVASFGYDWSFTKADCTFRLRPYEKQLRTRKSIISIPVSQRSLYVMSGSSRNNGERSILPVTEERFSITLRTLKIKPV
jgi:hypothetical protein